MKLWKRTVLLMLVTLLCALIPVGALSVFVTGKRSLNNAAETYGRQLENGKALLEQFWDNSKYEQMSETGKKAYMGFQFQRCCGAGMALIDKKSNAAIENLTDYEVVGIENLGLKNENDPYAYKIQKLGEKYLLLQKVVLSKLEGYDVLSVREVTGLFAELRQTAGWFTGIYLAVFLIAGLFIYMMMKRTVERMEKLQEVAEKQELLMGALSHEMRTPHILRNPGLIDAGADLVRRGGYIDCTAGADDVEVESDAMKLYELLHREGVKLDHVTISSDAFGSQPRFNEEGECIGLTYASPKYLHRTIQILVREGMPLEAALQLLTSTPAVLLGQEGVKGCVAEGADADLLVLDENLDINSLFARGQVAVWEQEVKMKGRFEQ